MTAFALNPLILTPLTCLLLLWPLIKLYRRVGLNPWWALLIFAELLIPFAGFTAALLPLATQAWPHFPKPPQAPKPMKTPI